MSKKFCDWALQVLKKFLLISSVIRGSGFFIRNEAFRYTFTQKGDPDERN